MIQKRLNSKGLEMGFGFGIFDRRLGLSAVCFGFRASNFGFQRKIYEW